MDLGIGGRKAIVCASSRGLGRACAKALAEAGCEVVINGRDPDRLAATAAELRRRSGAKITPVVADVASADGQKALFAACPEPDILVNNNGGPPFRDFRELDRQKMIDGLVANMIVAIELIQLAVTPLGRSCQLVDVVDNLTGLATAVVVAAIPSVIVRTVRGSGAMA